MDREATSAGASSPSGAQGEGARSASATPRPASSLRRHGVKLVLSLMLGGAVAWVLTRGGLPIVPGRAAFASLRPWTVAAYVAALAASHILRSVRWRHLLRPVGGASLRSILAVSWIGFGAILLSPLRSGEIVRPYLISKRSDVTVWEATGTVGAERVIDGLMLSVMLFIGLQCATPLAPLPDHVGNLPVPAAAVPKAAYAALALFVVAFALMGTFFFARRSAHRATIAVIGVVSRRFAERLAGIVEGVADGLRFLPSPRLLVPFTVETLAYWIVNAVGVQVLAWGCGLIDITLAQAAVVVGCLGVGILVPAGPGFFGAFQLSTYMALAMYFPESKLTGPGAAFVFLLYATQIGFHLVAMAAGLVLDRTGSAAGKREAPPPFGSGASRSQGT